MNIGRIRTILILSLLLVSLGGFMLHTRIHPLHKSVEKMVVDSNGEQTTVTEMEYLPRNLIPMIVGLVSIFLVSALFMSRKTAQYGYLLTGLIVIIGTITMGQFSVVNFKPPVTLKAIVFNTLLADILILWGKFFIAKAIYDTFLMPAPKPETQAN